MPKTRKVHSPDFKAKVAVDAIRGLKAASELASQYQVHPMQMSQWKKHALEGPAELFQRSQTNHKAKSEEELTAPLFEEIGRLKIELDRLKKICRAPQGISGC